MKLSITIKFRKHADKGLEDIQSIIWAIPGKLKVGHRFDSMNSMLSGKPYTLEYDTKENANKVANAIFSVFSQSVDVKKNH